MFKPSRLPILTGLAAAALMLALTACAGGGPTATPTATPIPLTIFPSNPTQPPGTPVTMFELNAVDQSLSPGDVVVISSVTSALRCWIVIHADANGKPGRVLGYTASNKGTSRNQRVKVDAAGLTPRVWVALHLDLGRMNTFEYPGADDFYKDPNGKQVMVSFKVYH